MVDKFVSKFKNLDFDFQEVLSKGVVSLCFKIGGAILAFVFNFLLAKHYGSEGVGVFFLMFSILNVGAMFCRMGIDNILVRSISEKLEKQDGNAIKQIVSKGTKLLLFTSILLGGCCLLFSNAISNLVFNKDDLTIPIQITSITLIPFTFILFYTEILKGIRNIFHASFLKGFGIYFVGTILLLILYVVTSNLQYEYIWILFVSSLLTASVGFIFWRYNSNRLITLNNNSSVSSIKTLIKDSRPLWISSMILVLSEHSTTMLLGIYGDNDSVGVFATCIRFGLLMVFCLDALNSILAPKFAQLYVKGKTKQIENISKKAVKLMVLFTFPVFLTLLVFSEYMLGIFGLEFIKGSLALKIIICSQFINLLTGPVGYVLIMTHNERVFTKINIFSFLVLLLLSFLLIPRYSYLGAAIAYAGAIIFKNLVLLFYVKKKVGISTLPF